MATADLTVIALGRPDASASAYIAEIQRRLAAQDRVRSRQRFALRGPRYLPVVRCIAARV